MRLAIVCSLTFFLEAGEIKRKLEEKGHSVSLPYSVERLLKGELKIEKINKMKQDGSFNKYVRSNDLIRRNWIRMKNDDAILVINLEKKGIKGYVGGNTFLEMGLAFVNHMKIFLWDPIPNMEYSDEIHSMDPVVINGNIDQVM